MTRDDLLAVIKAHAIRNRFALVEVREYGPGVHIVLDIDGEYTLYFDRGSVQHTGGEALPDQAIQYGVPDTVGYVQLDTTHQTGVTWELMLVVAKLCVRPRLWRDRYMTMFPE